MYRRPLDRGHLLDLGRVPALDGEPFRLTGPDPEGRPAPGAAFTALAGRGGV
ncbi:hypothetical protein ACPPVO_01500 [Dactylosporangium sp. McL0621]|uniref:hypothetical protein n=1 Tax=Dactylosporangium sp. McL0621 TaxID=3415678 RepID=UPI003CF7B23F